MDVITKNGKLKNKCLYKKGGLGITGFVTSYSDKKPVVCEDLYVITHLRSGLSVASDPCLSIDELKQKIDKLLEICDWTKTKKEILKNSDKEFNYKLNLIIFEAEDDCIY